MVQKIRKITKDKKQFTAGVVHIQSTFNNTIVTISNLTGDTISAASAGSVGFKGARKGTPFAAQMAAEKAGAEAFSAGLKTVQILEDRLAHITEPISLSIIGCVVNGPGEALFTDIGFTGGMAGYGMMYASGIKTGKTNNNDMIDDIVRKVEERANLIKKSQ